MPGAPTCGEAGRTLPWGLWKEHSPAHTLTSYFWAPEPQGNTFLSFEAAPFVSLCHSSHRKLTRLPRKFCSVPPGSQARGTLASAFHRLSLSSRPSAAWPLPAWSPGALALCSDLSERLLLPPGWPAVNQRASCKENLSLPLFLSDASNCRDGTPRHSGPRPLPCSGMCGAVNAAAVRSQQFAQHFPEL